MNILFTNFCNRSCPYCFAQGKLVSARDSRGSYISFKNLKIIINFLKQSEQSAVGIIGGEPTLHPKFKQALEMILKEGFIATIFSNGIINKEVVNYLRRTNQGRWKIILNINAPESYTKKEWLIINRTMRALNKKITLGFNIYRIDFNMDFMLNLIRKYKLGRSIRIGIACPIWGENNEYLPLEDNKEITPKILTFAKKCDDSDVSLNFDCGFMLCSFADKEIGQLFRYNSLLNTRCSSVIDVGPDLTLWNCFVTSKIWNRRLTDFKDLDEVNEFYINKYKPFRRVGATGKCFRCKYLKRGQCGGGCLGYILKSFNFEDKKNLSQLS